ncbi:hypothetical protein LTR95_012095 [Oleoguttula sp. CCFEE 5521]
MFVDEMSNDGLRVSVKMIADRKRKWGINDKNRRKNQEAVQTKTVLREMGTSSIRPIVLSDPCRENGMTTPVALVSSPMRLTTSVGEASLDLPMDHPAPIPTAYSISPSPPPPPLPDSSHTPRPTLRTVAEDDDDSECADHHFVFPANELIPSMLAYTALGAELASMITLVLLRLEYGVPAYHVQLFGLLVEVLLRARSITLNHVRRCERCAINVSPCANMWRKLHHFAEVFHRQLDRLDCLESDLSKFAFVEGIAMYWHNDYHCSHHGERACALLSNVLARAEKWTLSRTDAINFLVALPDYFDVENDEYSAQRGWDIPHIWECRLASANRQDCRQDAEECEMVFCRCSSRTSISSTALPDSSPTGPSPYERAETARFAHRDFYVAYYDPFITAGSHRGFNGAKWQLHAHGAVHDET